MRRLFGLLVLSLVLFASAHAAIAAERTVTLDVPMSCAACPYIVKRSLEKVAGVLDVTVSYDTQTATIRYDDQDATVATLMQATAAVGFQSNVAGSK